jgi:hypothetical protein
MVQKWNDELQHRNSVANRFDLLPKCPPWEPPQLVHALARPGSPIKTWTEKRVLRTDYVKSSASEMTAINLGLHSSNSKK